MLPVSRSVSWRTWATVFSANSAERLVDPFALLLHLPLQLGRRRGRGRAATSSLADEDRLAVDPHPVAVFEQLEEAGVGGVDQADPGAGQHQRPGVRIPARREEAEALRTAATPASISSSAAMRSMLTWSMTAMSPGRRRLTRCLVRSPEPGDAFDRRLRPSAVPAPEQGRKATATGGGHALRL